MKKWIKILALLALLGIAAGIFVYYFVYNKPHPDYEKSKAEYTMTAKELYEGFITGEATPGQKYNGKVIEISGLLSSVESVDSLVIVIFAFNQGMFGDEGVRCTMLPSFNEEAKNLVPGTEVFLKGLCTGFNGSDVILEKCSLPRP